MLTHISIVNFAIIERLDLELSGGMTVLTGETGAGKSIMIDAIGLALGDRADAGVVRHGAARAEIALTLDASRPAVGAWLAEHDLETDEECILRRVITAEGRSRATINGSPVTLALLRELGALLVDIHGQHAHQSLRGGAAQRALLDDFGELTEQTDAVRAAHAALTKVEAALTAIREGDQNRQARIDLLTFQVGELRELALEPDEIPRLDAELSQLGHADQLKAAAQQAIHNLYEQEDSLYQQIGGEQARLEQAAPLDARFSEPAELLQNALIQIEEAVSRLRELDATLESNPERLAEVETRIGRIHDLARKHRVEPNQLFDAAAAMEAELAELAGPENDLETLEQQVRELTDRYDELASALRTRRQAAASELNRLITASMQELGMEGGRFEARITPCEPGIRKAHGAEDIVFMVSANPGQPLQPITRVASGGELSRISLAIQLAASARTRVATMIFDEVDSGVGGAVAEVVGRQLQRLGQDTQVFCVTHLPQVAACGHHHLRVAKTKSSDSTHTSVEPLTETQRIEEIARMLGGASLTDKTRGHAEEMLRNSRPDQ